MVYPPNAELLAEARQAVNKNELPEAIAGLVANYLADQSAGVDAAGTLYLNASCEFIQTLARQTGPAGHYAASLTLIYQIARLFAGRMLSPADVKTAFTAITTTLTQLVTGLGSPNEKGEKAL